jgi:hypothetical protein
MSNSSVKLIAIEKGGRWTVRLGWPNGMTRHFGSFRSRTEAMTWIALNRWMTKAKIEERDVVRHRGTLAIN